VYDVVLTGVYAGVAGVYIILDDVGLLCCSMVEVELPLLIRWLGDPWMIGMMWFGLQLPWMVGCTL